MKANRLRAQISQAQRKADTRRKIVVGGMVLAAMDHDEKLRGLVLGHLRKFVTRPNDMEAVADLLGDTPAPDAHGVEMAAE